MDSKLTSSQLKDSTTVNFGGASNLINELKSSANIFLSSCKRASEDSTFKILIQLGLCGDFPSRYDSALESLVSSINLITSEANQYIDELNAEDNSVQEQFPESPRSNYGGGSSSGGTVPSEEAIPSVVELPDNTNDQLYFFNNITLEDLKELINILKYVAQSKQVTINELLEDESMNEELKNILLNDTNLSQDYRNIINEGSSISLINSLKSLLNGQIVSAFGLTDETSFAVKKYLTDMSTNNNISLEGLLNSQENNNFLQQNISNLKNINSSLSNITTENVQNAMYDIFDGNVDNETTVEIVRNQIDSIASSTGNKYEDLLEKNEYKETLFNCVEKLNRVSVLADFLLNNNDAGSILFNMLK